MSTTVSRAMTTHSPTEILSRYVVESVYDRVPREVTEAAKIYILDNVGCIIGGTQLGPSRIVIDLFREWGGADEAAVFGTDLRLPMPHAAYVKAYLANALDFDDTYLRRGHPGSSIIPAALAVAQRVGATGSELIQAVILGYEVSLRIGGAIIPTPQRFKQVWGLSTWGIFGAIAATARLLKLDVEQTRHAFGLGGLNAPVPNNRKLGLEKEDRPFGWAKNNYGWASMGAVIGCLMARRGFVGNRFILDGERGFWAMAGSDRCDFEALTAGLGRDYLLPNTGFKPYACCRWTQTGLDAARSLRARHPIGTREIVKVEVHTFGELVESFWGTRPVSIFDAQYNLPYVLALELLGRSPRAGLSEADLDNPDVITLFEKITLTLDAEADRRFFERALIPVRLVVTLSDGRVLEEYAEIPTGAPGGPAFTTDDVQTKFHELAEPVVGSKRARALRDIVLGLEKHTAADLVGPAEPLSVHRGRRSS